MYRMKLWDEDKWNIHSSSYNSSKYSNLASDDKKEDKKYHEQKYDAKEKDASSDYLRKQEDKDKEDKNPSHFDELVEDEKKEQKIGDDELTFKAAKQVFDEKRHEPQKAKVKKDIKTIEDAVKKAIEEEKQVIIMD